MKTTFTFLLTLMIAWSACRSESSRQKVLAKLGSTSAEQESQLATKAIAKLSANGQAYLYKICLSFL